ncbi:MAG TPA: major capsid protein [Pirellulaceae bacterium]|nr:major capsid protein [Pirellulaceae bacterium]
MSQSTATVLAPKTILQAISQLELPGTTLQNLFGWGFNGQNRLRQTGRAFSYDVIDHTRKIATARVPGQSANRQKPQKVRNITGFFPRSAETISLLDEDLLNRRRIGGQLDELDEQGESYLTRQEAYLGQRFANLVEFQTAAMLRGRYTFDSQGDDLLHGFSGGEQVVDFLVPDGNRGQLDMLGAGEILDADWATASTDIPLHLQKINAAMVQLTGLALSHVVLTGVGWQRVINNTKVQTLGGSANVVYEALQRVGAGEFTAVLRAIPWVTFHVVDYGLETWDGTNEAFNKLIQDDYAAFLPEPSPRWAQYLEGSEIVTEGPNGVKSEAFGFYPYAYPMHDPSGWDLCAVFNGLPALYLPKAVAYGRISGGSY